METVKLFVWQIGHLQIEGGKFEGGNFFRLTAKFFGRFTANGYPH